MTITAVTPTRDRPEAFALCELYMSRQTRKPDQWIVLDDGQEPAKCTMGQQHIYVPTAREGVSLTNKLKIALAHGIITSDALLIFEDDDHYTPEWVATCCESLETAKIFGEARAIYYNVRERWWFKHGNCDHASLCSTAMRREIFPLLLQQCQGQSPYVDQTTWNTVARNLRLVRDPEKHGNKHLIVGIKAMPGTRGYTGAHSVRDVNARDDKNLVKLREFIGDDADLYEPFYNNTGQITLPPTVIPRREAPVLHNANHTVKAAPTRTLPRMYLSPTDEAHGDRWESWLADIKGKPDIVGVEVGTFRGESAECFASRIFTDPSSRFITVDTFKGSMEHKAMGLNFETIEQEARARLKRFPNVEVVKDRSERFLRTFPNGLDFFYCDAGHDSMNVMRDSVLAFDLLKKGGVFCWDDLSWGEFPDPLDCPRLAIESFVKIYSRRLRVIHQSSQLAAVKIS